MQTNAYLINPESRSVVPIRVDGYLGIKAAMEGKSLDGVNFRYPGDDRFYIGLFVENFAYEQVPQPAHFYISSLDQPLIGAAVLYCSDRATGEQIDCPLSSIQVENLIEWGRKDTHIDIRVSRQPGVPNIQITEVPNSNN